MDLEARHQLKVPVVRRLEYTLSLEQANEHLTFVHCVIHGVWSKEVKKRLTQDWATLLSLHGGPIYALHNPDDKKHLKFITSFGFHKVDELVSGVDGQTYQLFKT